MLRKLVTKARNKASRVLLSEDGRKVLHDRLTYLTPQKLYRIERTARQVLRGGVAGDFLEMGVALGGSGIVLARIARSGGRRFCGYDVFGMIPEPTSNKDDEKSKNRYKVIASGASDGIGGDPYYGYRTELLDDVKNAFSRYKVPVDDRNVILTKGLFGDTLPNYRGTIAYTHVDCDWYDPVKLCLDFIAPKLSPGGMVVLDDYHDYGGARLAVDEFLNTYSDLEFLDGPNVILRKRLKSPDC